MALTKIVAVICPQAPPQPERAKPFILMAEAVQQICSAEPETNFRIFVFGTYKHDSMLSQAEAFERCYLALEPPDPNVTLRKFEHSDGLRSQVGKLYEQRRNHEKMLVMCSFSEYRRVRYELERYFGEDVDLVGLSLKLETMDLIRWGWHVHFHTWQRLQVWHDYAWDSCPAIYLELIRLLGQAVRWFRPRQRR